MGLPGAWNLSLEANAARAEARSEYPLQDVRVGSVHIPSGLHWL